MTRLGLAMAARKLPVEEAEVVLLEATGREDDEAEEEDEEEVPDLNMGARGSLGLGLVELDEDEVDNFDDAAAAEALNEGLLPNVRLELLLLVVIVAGRSFAPPVIQPPPPSATPLVETLCELTLPLNVSLPLLLFDEEAEEVLTDALMTFLGFGGVGGQSSSVRANSGVSFSTSSSSPVHFLFG